MPKQTFYNLPAEKQLNLMDAAKKEFSRVPLHEAVISNIIKSAQISRGSFYQYFEDLEDLFFYILDEHVKRNRERFASQLIENDGDLLETFVGVFQWMLKDFQQEEHRVFFHNAFLNMTHKMENAFTDHTDVESFMMKRSEFLSLINTDKMNITTDRELFHLMKIVQAVTFQNLIQSFSMHLPPEKALENFKLEMDMLKKGLVCED